MFRWFGGTVVGIIGLIVVAKYPDDVWNAVIWILQLCEHAADSIVATWRKTHPTGG